MSGHLQILNSKSLRILGVGDACTPLRPIGQPEKEKEGGVLYLSFSVIACQSC